MKKTLILSILLLAPLSMAAMEEGTQFFRDFESEPGWSGKPRLQGKIRGERKDLPPRPTLPTRSLKPMTENDKNVIRENIRKTVTENPNLMDIIKKGNSGEFILIFKPIIHYTATNFEHNETTKFILKILLLDAIRPMLDNLNKEQIKSWYDTIDNEIGAVFNPLHY